MSPPEDEDLIAPARTRWVAPAGVALVVIAAATWLLWTPAPPPLTDCGTVATATHPLKHDTFCTLGGTVEGDKVLSMGKGVPTASDDKGKAAGVRLFVKLADADVIAILSADRDDVLSWRARHQDTLEGFEVTGPGRVFDPDTEKGYEGTGLAVRKLFGLDPKTPVRFYDTAWRPEQ
ncbi:MAG: hypothetical protein H6704_18835 [Myxococcales bacterium]|nr:hypothetical protein [Myxococcales bacterium]MCB9538311.1 hypothetical protein [Myxococcales bacterium]